MKYIFYLFAGAAKFYAFMVLAVAVNAAGVGSLPERKILSILVNPGTPSRPGRSRRIRRGRLRA